ncbi:hypothetical protein BN1708_019568, partial [Verticillium longisporum]
DEAPRHQNHTLQAPAPRHPRLPRLCRPQRRRPHSRRQGAVRGPVSQADRRGPRFHRVHDQVRCRRAAALHAERRCPPLRHQHPHRRLRQRQQGPQAVPD